jgi:RNA polymerase sigma-70 factor (ECF subfamily)
MERAMWPDAAETSDLLAGAREGDAAAVERLLGRHRDALRRVVALRLDPAIRRRVDASDIIQDALIEAARRLPEYLSAPPLPFHVWLRRIALDRLIDAHRKHHAAACRSVEKEERIAHGSGSGSSIEPGAVLADPAPTPAAAAVRGELARRFQEALSSLREDDRDVILMRHFEGLSNQDVARSLELSEPAAAMRYMRALRRIRDAMEAGDGSGHR